MTEDCIKYIHYFINAFIGVTVSRINGVNLKVKKGKDITGKSPDVIADKYKIGRKFQGANVFDNITVLENLEISLCGYCSVWKAFTYKRNEINKKRIDELLSEIELTDVKNVLATELSHGQR